MQTNNAWSSKVGYHFFIFIFSISAIGCGHTSQESIVRAEHLIKPDQLTETFMYWGENICVVVPDTMNGRKIIHAFHSPLSPNRQNQTDYDNDILDGATLQPIEKHTANGTIIYDYSIKGEVKLKFIGTTKDTATQTIKISHPNYNLKGPGTGVFFACLPLKTGFKTEFLEIRSDFPYEQSFKTVVNKYKLNVIGEEKIVINNKSFATYVVEVDSDSDSSGIYMKRWVTKRPPHHGLQFIYTIKNGEKNYKSLNPPYTIRDIFFTNNPN